MTFVALPYRYLCLSDAGCTKEEVPLLFWGEPSAEYTAYYSYDEPEEVDELRFNRYINLGISSDDMLIRLGGVLDERDLAPFKYPELSDLKAFAIVRYALGAISLGM